MLPDSATHPHGQKPPLSFSAATGYCWQGHNPGILAASRPFAPMPQSQSAGWIASPISVFYSLFVVLLSESFELVKLAKFNIPINSLTYFIIKKESSRAISRVLSMPLVNCQLSTNDMSLSFIYSMSHPMAQAFYPPPYEPRPCCIAAQTFVNSGGQPSLGTVYMNLQPPAGTAQ